MELFVGVRCRICYNSTVIIISGVVFQGRVKLYRAGHYSRELHAQAVMKSPRPVEVFSTGLATKMVFSTGGLKHLAIDRAT